MKAIRTDLSKLSDADYHEYKRKFNAKRQKKYRRKMKRLGIPIASNMSFAQRAKHYASKGNT
jgi:hypothetical protein